MALHWPTFFTRLGSAIVYSAIMMLGLLWNHWAFVALVLLIMNLCIRDFFRLTEKIDGVAYFSRQYRVLPVFASLLCLFVAALQQVRIVSAKNDAYTLDWVVGKGVEGIQIVFWVVVFLVLAIPLIVALVRLLSRMSQGGSLGDRLRQGVGYVVVPSLSLILLRHMQWTYPLILILCIWMNDTMAYLVGSFIGKTPFSKISPKKTWEGTAGGAILAVAGAAIAAYYIPEQNMIVYIALSLCAAVAGTAGDLYESKLKRQAGVKDSGTMMPGHGGALDRFDSLLFAAPCALVGVLVLRAAGLA